MNAETWDDLASAATQSSIIDPVIQLVREGNSEPAYAPEGVKKLVLRDTSDLFLAFADSPLVKIDPKIKLRANAKPLISRIVYPTVPQPTDGATDVDRAQNPENQHPSNLEDPFTDNEHNAAREIQAVYRRFRRRMMGRTKRDPAGHWFSECLAINTSLDLSRSYRMTFLGPLPHFLLCLDAFRKHQEEQKRNATGLVRTVDQRDLKNAIETLTKIMWVSHLKGDRD